MRAQCSIAQHHSGGRQAKQLCRRSVFALYYSASASAKGSLGDGQRENVEPAYARINQSIRLLHVSSRFSASPCCFSFFFLFLPNANEGMSMNGKPGTILTRYVTNSRLPRSGICWPPQSISKLMAAWLASPGLVLDSPAHAHSPSRGRPGRGPSCTMREKRET